MATEALRIKLEELRDIERTHISRFEIPSVAPSTTSDVYFLDTGVREGTMQVVRIASETGVDYTVSFRCIESADEHTVDEIHRVEDIDSTGYQATNLGIIYSNDDEIENPDEDDFFGGELPYMYVVIINNDGGTATGVVTIEVVIQSGD